MATDLPHNPSEVEEIAFARQDGLPFEIEIMRLEKLLQRDIQPDLTRPQRIHFHHLFLVEQGDSYHSVDFERYPARRGHLLVVPQGHVQAFSPERQLSGYIVVFTQNFLQRCGQDIRQLGNAFDAVLRAAPHIQLSGDSFSLLRRAIQSLEEYTQVSPDHFADDAIAASFSLLVFTLARLPEMVAAAAAHQPDDELAAKFMGCLEEHFASEHQATFYADALHVSLRTLDRHLLDVSSQTTHQAIVERLVLEAKRLLTRKDIRIKSIAQTLGFSEPQTFTRFFRTQTGLSPKSFRESLNSQ